MIARVMLKKRARGAVINRIFPAPMEVEGGDGKPTPPKEDLSAFDEEDPDVIPLDDVLWKPKCVNAYDLNSQLPAARAGLDSLKVICSKEVYICAF